MRATLLDRLTKSKTFYEEFSDSSSDSSSSDNSNNSNTDSDSDSGSDKERDCDGGGEEINKAQEKSQSQFAKPAQTAIKAPKLENVDGLEYFLDLCEGMGSNQRKRENPYHQAQSKKRADSRDDEIHTEYTDTVDDHPSYGSAYTNGRGRKVSDDDLDDPDQFPVRNHYYNTDGSLKTGQERRKEGHPYASSEKSNLKKDLMKKHGHKLKRPMQYKKVAEGNEDINNEAIEPRKAARIAHSKIMRHVHRPDGMHLTSTKKAFKQVARVRDGYKKRGQEKEFDAQGGGYYIDSSGKKHIGNADLLWWADVQRKCENLDEGNKANKRRRQEYDVRTALNRKDYYDGADDELSIRDKIQATRHSSRHPKSLFPSDTPDDKITHKANILKRGIGEYGKSVALAGAPYHKYYKVKKNENLSRAGKLLEQISITQSTGEQR